MTIADALTIAHATRKQIHDLGYANADDAIARAAELLADEVEAYQAMRCEDCRRVWRFRGDGDVPHCRATGRNHETIPCSLLGGGCKGFQPRVSE